jgi:DNA-binding response OmpR family regulator
MNKILIIDDEEILVKGISAFLKQDGNVVDCAYDGKTGHDMIKEKNYDLILLDYMLPNMNGLELLQAIRNEDIITPIIILTAKSDSDSKIRCLEFGADDYITKPFDIIELKSRIKALLRRISYYTENNSSIIIKNVEINLNEKRVYVDGKEVLLTTKEFEILSFLAINKNKIYDREGLLNSIWGYDYYGDSRTVDVHIRRIREKVELNPEHPEILKTKWGSGYYVQV